VSPGKVRGQQNYGHIREEGVREAFRKQDEHLDAMADDLDQLQGLALEMNREFGKQRELVSNLEGKAQKASTKLKENQKELEKVK